MRNRMSAFSLVTGMTLLAFITGAFIVSSLLFLLKIPMTALHIWLVIALAAGTAWITVTTIQAERPGRLMAGAIIASFMLFAVFFWVSGAFYDLSYDGQSYHQEAIIYLNDGWNPVYDKALDVSTGNGIWVNHYARAAETAAAVVFKATGLIEHSKVFNLLAVAASFLLSLAALFTLKPGNTGRAIMVAALLALNPVSIYQLFSYYVDGLLASMLLCLVALGCLIFARPGWLLLSAYTAAMIFTINIKFTAIAYAGVLTIGLLIALYMSEQFDRLKQLFKIAAIGSLVAVLLVGFNPFVTNTMAKGNPLYPLAGKGAIDVVKNFTPRNLESMNRIDQLVHSYFATTTGNSAEKKPTVGKVPFTFTKSELVALGDPDVAVSGFGPLFSGILLLAVVVLILSFRVRVGLSLAALGLIVLLLISVLVNPASWWARYVPQLWLIPLLCVWLGFNLKENRTLAGASWLLAGVIAVNALMVGGTYTYHQWSWSQTLSGQLSELQALSASKPVPAEFTYSWSNQERFKQLGIAFKEENPLQCGGQEQKMSLIKSGTSVCVQK